MTMFEYSKLILEKVSFEPSIFKKELRKALRIATKEEFKELKAWCKQKFGKKIDVKSKNISVDNE
jgi:hypothetical protein